jgi:hypothetical protein
MENCTYVGLDLSKTITMATAVGPLGHRIRQEKLGVSDVELLRFLAEIPERDSAEHGPEPRRSGG